MSKLQEAFREAARREFAMVPAEDELDYTFSPKFQRRMRRIIRAQTHGYWQFVNTTAKRVACAAVIILTLLTSAMAIKPIRQRVIQFFVEVYEEYFAVTFGEEESGDLYAPAEPMTRYTLSWVPEGCYEANYYEFDALLNTIWKQEDQVMILLSQGTGTHNITLDHTDDMFSEFKHKDLLITHQTFDMADEYMWEQNGYIFHLTVFDDIPIDEILQMIDSLQINTD